MKSLLTILVLLCAVAASAASFTLRFAWELDTNAVPDLTHSRLYWRTGGTYNVTNSVAFTNVAQSVTNSVSGFAPNTAFFFVVTCTDRWNRESAQSQEITTTTPLPPVPPPPVLFRYLTNTLQASSGSGFTNVVSVATAVPVNESNKVFRGFLVWGPTLDPAASTHYIVTP
jgi:hypothetical protein